MSISILGINIKQFRENKSMTQSYLARKANVGKATINEIENGKRQSLNSNTINKISKALNVSSEVLLNKNSNPLIEKVFKKAFKEFLNSSNLTINGVSLSDFEKFY